MKLQHSAILRSHISMVEPYCGSTMVLSFYIAIMNAVQCSTIIHIHKAVSFLPLSPDFLMCKSFLAICSVTLKSKRFITKHYSSLVSWAAISQTVGQGPFNFTATPKRLVYLQCELPIPLVICTPEKI